MDLEDVEKKTDPEEHHSGKPEEMGISAENVSKPQTRKVMIPSGDLLLWAKGNFARCLEKRGTREIKNQQREP